MTNHKLLLATSTLIGVIIGAGIFGLPFIFYKAGFLIGLFFLIALTFITIIIHLIWAEISIDAGDNHRLPGYSKIYLGNTAKRITGITTIFGFLGSLTAYMLIGGNFLGGALGHILGQNQIIYILIFWAITAFAIFKELKIVALLEFIISLVLAGIILVFFGLGISKFDFGNLPLANWQNFFLPYGIILFSLAGGSAIPEIRDILKGKENKLKKAIILGTVIPAILYLLFVLGIMGVSNSNISEYALSGLSDKLGEGIIFIGQIFGFFAVITSVFVLGLYLKHTFTYDYRINKNLSFALATFLPLLTVLFIKNLSFIQIIEAVGVISIGIEGIILILIHRKLRQSKEMLPTFIKLPKFIDYLIIGIFVSAIIYYFI